MRSCYYLSVSVNTSIPASGSNTFSFEYSSFFLNSLYEEFHAIATRSDATAIPVCNKLKNKTLFLIP